MNNDMKIPEMYPPSFSTWLRRNWQKVIALIFWAGVVSFYWWYTQQQGVSPLGVLRLMVDWFVSSAYGPLVFILFFALQPLIFFPSTLMGILSGTLYGPGWGFLYAILGGNGAALLTYSVGYFFGHEVLERTETDSMVGRYLERLHANAFETILIMHLIFLPYDLVNYMVGFLRIRWQPFLLATALGSLPGTLTFVLFGASMELQTLGTVPSLNYYTLAGSAAMLIISLTLSRLIKRRRPVDRKSGRESP